MSKIVVNSLVSLIVARLQARIDSLQPGSPELLDAFRRIGVVMVSYAQMNIRRQGIIDTGRLLNSIRFEPFHSGTVTGIKIGSFGVPYAAMHEFGGVFTPLMRRAMFANMARRSRPKGKDKNVISDGRFRARPYLIPAIQKAQPLTIDLLREALKLKG